MKLRICDLKYGDVLRVRGYVRCLMPAMEYFLYRGSLVSVVSSQDGGKQALVLYSAPPGSVPNSLKAPEGTVYDLYTQNRGYGDNIQTLYERA